MEKRDRGAASGRRRATRAEQEARLAELCELLATRVPRHVAVRYACQKWGLGERAAQKYVAAAEQRLRARAPIDGGLQFGLACAGHELILRRQLSAGDLRAARATLDRLVALLGLAKQARRPLDLAAMEAEIARLEVELARLAERTP